VILSTLPPSSVEVKNAWSFASTPPLLFNGVGVFENRVLRRIFGPEREDDGSWRKLHSDELHSLYSSPNIVQVIKLRRLRWAGHVARMGRGVVFTGF
jgi:hypothetical protein